MSVHADRPKGSRPGVVVAAIDEGGDAVPVLRASARYAQMCGASLIALHVSPVPVTLAADSGFMHIYFSAEEVEARLLPVALEALYDCDVKWRLLVLRGDPARRLAEVANLNQALAVVVGAHSRRWLNKVRPLRRSIPHRLTRLQSSPVILVPSDDSTIAPDDVLVRKGIVDLH